MTIPLNLTAPLKKLDYNYIGLENGYFNTDCTGDPFGIKANNIYPGGHNYSNARRTSRGSDIHSRFILQLSNNLY